MNNMYFCETFGDVSKDKISHWAGGFTKQGLCGITLEWKLIAGLKEIVQLLCKLKYHLIA